MIAGTSLVKDIDRFTDAGPFGLAPDDFTLVGSTLFFAASTGSSGRELWKRDESGRYSLVSDLVSGAGSSSPKNLTAVGNLLFFTAETNLGRELWKTDGTEPGTQLVLDVWEGMAGSEPKELTAVGSKLFFGANDGTTGFELWVTDELGTRRLSDIQEGANGSDPTWLTAVGETLYFVADNGNVGSELWKSDGTVAGTQLVTDINPFPNTGSAIQSLTNVNGALYFSANDGSSGTELWTVDATGAVLAADVAPGEPGSTPAHLTNVNGILFFAADNGTLGSELYKFTPGVGLELVRDIQPGVAGSNLKNFVAVTSQLYFSADDGEKGDEVWKSDGTLNGTELVANINTTPGMGSDPAGFALFDSIVYFTADDGFHGAELWKTSGNASSTFLVRDLAVGTNGSSPNQMIGFGGALYFSANTGEYGFELFRSGGLPENTVEESVWSRSTALPEYLTGVGSTLYFAADDGYRGKELWKSDGTRYGTVLVKDIWTGGGSSLPKYLTDVNGTLFFVAFDEANGTELRKSDGTEEGTVVVPISTILGVGSDPQFLTVYNGALYFSADDQLHGRELWKWTPVGVSLVKNIMQGSGASDPRDLVVSGQTLFFTADDGNGGRELWKSDGTEEGTVLVKDLNNQFFVGSNPLHLTDANGTLFFTANIGDGNGQELWQSDGTEQGTYMAANIGGNWSSSPQYLTYLNGILYFSADGGETGREFWKYTLATETDEIVRNIHADAVGQPWNSNPRLLTVVNGIIFFAADDSTGSGWLWRSEGTEETTTAIKTDSTGTVFSGVANLINGQGNLYFSADYGVKGVELGKTAGTAIQTFFVDINAGTYGSHPQNFAVVGSRLFFAADDGRLGYELWDPPLDSITPTSQRPNSTSESEAAGSDSPSSPTFVHPPLLLSVLSGTATGYFDVSRNVLHSQVQPHGKPVNAVRVRVAYAAANPPHAYDARPQHVLPNQPTDLLDAVFAGEEFNGCDVSNTPFLETGYDAGWNEINGEDNALAADRSDPFFRCQNLGPDSSGAHSRLRDDRDEVKDRQSNELSEKTLPLFVFTLAWLLPCPRPQHSHRNQRTRNGTFPNR